MPILMHWIKVASITYITVTREYKASLGMMKLVKGLRMRCLKVTRARGLCIIERKLYLRNDDIVFTHVDRHIYGILKMSQNGYHINANDLEGGNSFVLSQDLYELLVLGFCGFLNTELTIKSDEMEIPFSLISFSFFFFLLTSKVVQLKPYQPDWWLWPCILLKPLLLFSF